MISGFMYLFVILLVAAELANAAAETDSSAEKFQHEFAKASCDFTLDLLKTVESEDEDNVLLSPSSISIILAILQQGANGNTAAQLEKTLRLSPENSKKGYGRVIKSLEREKTNVTLEWGNRAYIVPGFALNDTFLKTIEDDFNVTVEELNITESTTAEVAAQINDWVSDVTRDNIKDLVDESLITADVVMLMINAIYFKSIWETPFRKYKTKNSKFHIKPDLKVEVPFMRQEGTFVAGEDAELGIKWAELPFQDDNFSMIFVLPTKAHGLNQVIEKLTGANLKEIITGKTTRRVKWTIPKFKLTKKVSLAETLKKLGVTDIFTVESDLTGIADGEKTLHLSNLIHQANVEIDEEGSVAAAATFELVQTLSLEWFPDELDFRADHPFLFFIIDKLNEIPIFSGKISNPKTLGFKQ